MATKLYNNHIARLMAECKEYYILDCYISLVHISSEIDGKFIIQTYTDSKVDLINCIKNNVDATYKTIYNCIDRLMKLDIIFYDATLQSWVIKDMEYMVHKKEYKDDASKEEVEKYTGYTLIRPIFLTSEFNKMKLREKKILIYMAQLSDSNKSNLYDGFKMDLNNPNSRWYGIINTRSKYYARKTIDSMFIKYKDILENISDIKDYIPKAIRNFRFHFLSPKISTKCDDNTTYNMVVLSYPNEAKFVTDSIKSFDVTLSKQKVVHLIRAIINIKNWLLKERVVTLILKKYKAIQYYKSREDIKSLPKYAAAVVKAVIEEYKATLHAMQQEEEEATIEDTESDLRYSTINTLIKYNTGLF